MKKKTNSELYVVNNMNMKKNQYKSIRKYNKNWNATVANSNINKKKLEQLLSRRIQKNQG